MTQERSQTVRFSRTDGLRFGAELLRPGFAPKLGIALRLGLVLNLATLVGCVSQGNVSTEEARLRAVLDEMPLSEPESVSNSQDESSFDDYRIHLKGLVECGGFLSKQQTVFAEAWATQAGTEDTRAELNELELKLEYLDGIFTGVERKIVVYGKPVVRLSDVMKGSFLSDPCGCARFVATGKIPSETGGRVRTRLKVCPAAPKDSEESEKSGE
jgi:hypothetical protein